MLQIERVLCDDWLSNMNASFAASCVFNVVYDNWHPAIYPDDIIQDEDFLGHLFSMVTCLFGTR